MLIQKRRLFCRWMVALSFLFAVSAWAQITSGDGAYTLTTSSGIYSGSDGLVNASNPTASAVPAVHDATTHGKVSDQDSTPVAIKKAVTESGAGPNSAENNLPSTITVKTAALLELHAMRQSAVDLCIQLPTKYRTRLPECAEIFKHEIRLQGLAKDHK